MENQLTPPIAARLLLRLTAPSRVYAEVAADLAEEFAQSPSPRWYWGQVLGSVRYWAAPHLEAAALILVVGLILPELLLDVAWTYCASSVPLKMSLTNPPLYLRLALFLPPILALLAPHKETT